jgi:hypothetical protein
VPGLDRFSLYELCAQAPARDVNVLRAIHGGSPRVLGEDFCGTAALSHAWSELDPRNRAVAVDHDAATLARAHRHRRVGLIRADVMAVREPVDLIAVLNYSIAEIHDRARLVKYLAHARDRLSRRKESAFVCDIYGGTDAFLTGTLKQRFAGPAGERIDYSWEQRTADPFTGRVVDAMHFELRPPARAKKQPRTVLRDAFVYDWRLWSVPELRDAMREAGFSRTEIFPRQPDAIDADGGFHLLPVEDPAEVGDSFSVYVVGRR